MDESDNDDLQRRARESYEAAVARLDPETITGLEEARRLAIDELSGRSKWLSPGPGNWVPAAMAAGIGSLAIGWLMLAYQGDSAEVFSDDAMADDIEIMLAGENLDLLEELDFYLWLATQPDVG
jgi:hypothetical protein